MAGEFGSSKPALKAQVDMALQSRARGRVVRMEKLLGLLFLLGWNSNFRHTEAPVGAGLLAKAVVQA
jgi:hypothetical protein